MLKEIKNSHKFYLKRIKIATNLLILSGTLWGISYFFIDKNIWAVYCGFISYVLVGVLFFGEILFRKVFIKGV